LSGNYRGAQLRISISVRENVRAAAHGRSVKVSRPFRARAGSAYTFIKYSTQEALLDHR
jgi:hypothetical protein